MPDSKIVIIGASYAGHTVARALKDARGIHVTVLERKSDDVFIHKIGAARAVVAGTAGWNARTLPASRSALEGCVFVQGAVARSVDAAARVVTYVQDGEECSIEYDYLVIASGADNALIDGSTPEAPRSRADVTRRFESIERAIRKASSVVVVGGGAVGVEVATEIRVVHPKKRIVVVDSADSLLRKTESPEAFTNLVAQKLTEEMSIEVILNDRTVEPPPSNGDPFRVASTVALESGARIDADLIVYAVGASPNSSFVPPEWLDDRGLVRVDDRCRASERVFALGDASTVNPMKLGYLAEKQARYVAEALKRLAADENAKIDPYRPDAFGVVILSMGDRKGVSKLPFYTFGDWVTTLVKSKGLFASKMWRDLGFGSPPAPDPNWKTIHQQ